MTYVLFNNEVTTREHVKIDMEDRGYNFGDGIYEVIPVYKTKTVAMEEHLQRFEESASKLEIQLPYDRNVMSTLLNELKTKNKITDGIIYVQMTRGVSPRAHLYERNATGLITGFTREMPFPVDQKQTGIQAYVTEDIRWLRCDIKTINLLGNTMVKRMATDNLCQEGIMHRNGTMTEGSSSNLFMVKDGTIYTHPATNLILNGITRQIVIELARTNGYNVVEETFTTQQLQEADEAFITSTTQEVTPIAQIHGNIEAQFAVGPVTKTLQQLYAEYINENRK